MQPNRASQYSDGSGEPSEWPFRTLAPRVIVYREHSATAKSADLIRHFQTRLYRFSVLHPDSHDEIVELVTGFGDLETAITDFLCPVEDAENDFTQRLRQLSTLLGRMLYRSWTGKAEARKWVDSIARETEMLASRLPANLEIRTPEGYAHYGLAPEMYAESARKFSKACGPELAVCIGIRSIGTSLSGVVAGALEELGYPTTSLTLRPRGHPSDRRTSISHETDRLLENHRSAFFLVIDEGPGLSGSSFGCVAEALSRAGIPDDRICLFPSWIPDPDSLSSEIGRLHWKRHRIFCTSFNEVYIDSRRLFAGNRGRHTEISAGQWRGLLYKDPDAYPAVHPQHEMRKFLLYPDLSNPLLYKFAGYGDRARAKLHRAKLLENAGFGTPVRGLRSGFIITDFIPGEPLYPGAANKSLLQEVARYLAFVSRHFGSGEAVRLEDGIEMIRTNILEALGQKNAAPLARLDSMVGKMALGESVETDGRMLPHEWIRNNGSYIKTDALDHHNDHFFPGPQDIAWDVAAFSIEFDLSAAQQNDLIGFLDSSVASGLSSWKMLFYRIFYLAFRTGYTSLAAGTLTGSADGQRFRKLFLRYSHLLQLELQSIP